MVQKGTKYEKMLPLPEICHLCAMLIPKLTMLTLRVHYEPLNSNWSEKCECAVEFLLFSYKRLCTVAFGIQWSHFLSSSPKNIVFTTKNPQKNIEKPCINMTELGLSEQTEAERRLGHSEKTVSWKTVGHWPEIGCQNKRSSVWNPTPFYLKYKCVEGS